MTEILNYFPGQQVTIFQTITDSLGQRTDGYAFPIVSRIIFPGFTLATGFPQTMLRLDVGLYYFQFVLPNSAGAIGSYEVEVMFQNPDTGFVNYNYFQVNVTAPFGSGSITVPSTPPNITPVPGLPAPTGPASGDLGGFYPDPTVVGLQGQPISTILPGLGQVLEWSGTAWTPTTFNVAGGDLSGIYPNPKVIAIQGNPIISGSLTSDQDGYVLTWVNADGQWEPKQHTTIVFLSGDVVGNSSSNTVININGSSVPAGPLTVGNVLQANGPTSLTYAPINLAGGSDFVTGVLPIGNQAPQTMSGDVLGTTAASTVTLAGDVTGRSGVTIVEKINGNTVPIGTGNAVGNGLYVTVAGAAGTLAYSALNLAGGSNFVTGNLPVSNIAPGTSAQILMSDGTPATTWTTISGDVSITNTGVTAVLDINGASVPVAGALTTGNVLQVNGASSLTYAAVNLAGGSNFVTGVLPAGNQAAQTMGGDVNGTTASSTVVFLSGTTGSVQASIGSLGAGAGAFYASTGLIQVPNNNNAGALAFINERNNINTADQNILGYSFGVLTMGNTAQVSAIVGNSVQLNTANGTPFVVSTSAATMTGLPTFQWSANTPNPIITQVTPTSDVATQNITISPQAPFASASVNTTPGSLIVSLPIPAAGGNEAFFEINRASGGSSYTIGPFPGFPTGTAVWNGVTPSATNYNIAYFPTVGVINYNINSVSGAAEYQFFADISTDLFFIGTGATVNGRGTNLTGNNSNFGGGVRVVKLTDATTLPTSKPSTSSLLYSNTGSLETTGSGYNFHNLVTSPTIKQTAAISDVATQNLTISSQAPFASAVTHTSPGNIILSVPSPVANGATTGNIQLQSDGYTLATFGSTGLNRGSSSIALSTGTVTLANYQYCLPRLKFTGSLSGNVTVVLPASDGAEWIIDASAVALDGYTVTLQANSNNWATTIEPTSLYWVTYSAALGTGELAGTTLFSVAAAPGTAAYNPTWYAKTDIYWDPQAGNDGNSGDIGSPVLTFAEIIRRYGSKEPQFNYGQSVTIHMLSSQPANQDEVFFEPYLSGGGQAILLGTLTTVQAAFTSGTITAKTKTPAPGTRLQVASMPGGTVANQLVFNSQNSPGSYAFIDSMSGSTATMQQPLTTPSITTPNVPASVEDNSWTTGDTITIYTVPICNLGSWNPVAVDENVGSTKASVGWVQWINIVDASGNNGNVYGHTSRCTANVLSSCLVSSRLNVSSSNGRGQTAYLVGCSCVRLTQFFSAGGEIFGGGFASGVTGALGFLTIAADATMHATTAAVAGSQITLSSAFSDGTILAQSGGQFILSAAGAIWGSAIVILNPMGSVFNNTGGLWVNAWLANGAMEIGGVTTGSVYNGSGAMTDGVTINPGNIDTGGTAGAGIFNVRTGARYCNAT